MYLAIKDVKPLDNYLLILTFENGESREFDVKPYMDMGIFRELKDIRLFNTVKKSFVTIKWENEADFSPEFLYRKSVSIDNSHSIHN